MFKLFLSCNCIYGASPIRGKSVFVPYSFSVSPANCSLDHLSIVIVVVIVIIVIRQHLIEKVAT